MNKPVTAFAALGLATALLAARPAVAETFQFSYLFNTGELVTGSFSGTLNSDLVENISQIAVNINGTPLAGPVAAFRYTSPGSNCATCFASSGAVASFNPLKNNFFFSNGDATTGIGVTNYFYVIPWPNGVGNPVATQALFDGNYIDFYNGQYIPQNWHLAAVPEPSPTILLLLGLSTIGIFRSRGRMNS